MASAQLNANGVAELYKAGGASKLQYEQALAQVKQIQAQIEASRTALRSKSIKAPYDGIIGTVNVAEGDLVTSTTTVFTINSLKKDDLYVDVSVAPELLNEISIKNPVQITNDKGDLLATGEVSSIDATINQATGLSKVHVTLTGEPEVTAGQFVRVDVAKNTLEEQLVIPELAVNYSVYGETLYKLVALSDEDRAKLKETLFANETDEAKVTKSLNEIYKVSQIFIKSSERFNDTALVTEGLSAGDIIITQPDNLIDGSYVRVKAGHGLGVQPTFKLPAIAQPKKSNN